MARKVIVAGAGASGLVAAIAAAREGAEVTVLEAMDRPGRKLLLTGNGRCNLTNMDPELSARYYGSGQGLAQSVTERFGAEQTRRFFEELGLLTIERNGYVYPYSMQSSAVLDVLLAELRRLKVKLKFNEKIVRIKKREAVETVCAENQDSKFEQGQEQEQKQKQKQDRIGDERRQSVCWEVKTSSWSYQADAIVLACGSRCLPKTGSDGSGYRLAAQLGHRIITPRPALAALNCSGDFFASLAGVRCRARVTLLADGQPVKEEIGELQWTKYGVSGIVVFQLSRFVSTDNTQERQRRLNSALSFQAEQAREHSGRQASRQLAESVGSYILSVDFLPEFEHAYLVRLLSARAEKLSKETAAVLLKGMLHEKLIPVVLSGAGINKSQTCKELIEQNCDGASARVKKSRTCTELVDGTENKKSKICEKQDVGAVDRLVSCMKAFTIPVTGVRSFDECQVCSGGVDCREIVAETLESKLHRNLYFAGELLGVDGPCGGYNLQWAWASGYIAGQAAAQLI